MGRRHPVACACGSKGLCTRVIIRMVYGRHRSRYLVVPVQSFRGDWQAGRRALQRNFAAAENCG